MDENSNRETRSEEPIQFDELTNAAIRAGLESAENAPHSTLEEVIAFAKKRRKEWDPKNQSA